MTPHAVVAIPDALIDEIQFEIPEAPFHSVEKYLKTSIVTFCEKSNYWQEDLTSIEVVENVISYSIPQPVTTDVVNVISIYTDECQELQRSQGADIEFRYWLENPFTIAVAPTEKLSGRSLIITASVKPKIESENFEFSTWLLRDYREALIAGAKAMLYKSPRKPWTD